MRIGWQGAIEGRGSKGVRLSTTVRTGALALSLRAHYSLISLTSASFRASKMSFRQAFLVFSRRISKSGAFPAETGAVLAIADGEAVVSWVAELGAGLTLLIVDTGGVASLEVLPAGGVAFADPGVLLDLSPPFKDLSLSMMAFHPCTSVLA